MNASMNYVDGNAAGGELSRIFAVDITSAEGQCANCGAKRRFAGTFVCAVSRSRCAVPGLRACAPATREYSGTGIPRSPWYDPLNLRHNKAIERDQLGL